MADNKEQGFNDSELQDIMSEIENLEREYEGDSPESTDTTSVETANATDSVTEEIIETVAEKNVTEITEDNVVQFEPKKTAEVPTSSGEHQVGFHGAGKVDFSLSFEVAGQTANLKITKEGLAVTIDGMNLTIDETSGCTIEMEGGVKFSVPMGGQAKANKAA